MPRLNVSPTDINRERERLANIANFLAKNGQQTLKQLHDQFHANYTSQAELQNFLQKRSHVFLIGKDGKVSNRLDEYSKAFIAIFTETSNLPGAKMPEIQLTSRLLKSEVLLSCAGLKTLSVQEFLDEHRFLLNSISDSVEIKKPNLDQQNIVPSHWSDQCLPKIQILDRSLAIEMRAAVVQNNIQKNTLRLYIEKPDCFAKQIVTVTGTEQTMKDLCLRNPEGKKVMIHAARDYSMIGDPWQAATILPNGGQSAAQAKSVAPERSLNDAFKASASIQADNKSGARQKVSGASAQVSMVKVFSALDSILSETNPVEMSNLKSRHVAFKEFESDYTLQKFIMNRPHCYNVVGSKAFRRSERHRFVLKALYDDMKKRGDYTVDLLASRMGNFSVGFMADTYGRGLKAVEDFLSEHQHILKVEPGQTAKLRKVAFKFDMFFPPIRYVEAKDSPSIAGSGNFSAPPQLTAIDPDYGTLQIISVIDRNTSLSPIDLEQLWNFHKHELQTFPYYNDFKQFVVNCPHLYKFSNDARQLIEQRPARHRHVLRQLSAAMNRDTFTVNSMGQRLAKIDATFITDFYSGNVFCNIDLSLCAFIADHASIFEAEPVRLQNDMQKIRLAKQLVFPR